MAAAFGMIGGCRSSSSWTRLKDPKKKMRSGNGVRVCCISSSSRIDPYRTLRIQPGASESEVKKAFRQLALKYHPDVCSGSNCGVQFHQIYEAYDIVMNNLRNELTELESEEEEVTYEPYDASAGGSYDPNNLWEEWMGWEGAGIRDYSSHINPNI